MASTRQQDEGASSLEPAEVTGRTWPDMAHSMLFAKPHRFVLLSVAIAAGLIAGGLDAGTWQNILAGLSGLGLTAYLFVAFYPSAARWCRNRKVRARGMPLLRKRYTYGGIEPASWGLAVKLRCPEHSFMASGQVWRTRDENPQRYAHMEYFLRDIRDLDRGHGRLHLYTRHKESNQIGEQLFLLFDFGERHVTLDVGDDMPSEDRKGLFERVTTRFGQLEGVVIDEVGS